MTVKIQRLESIYEDLLAFQSGLLDKASPAAGELGAIITDFKAVIDDVNALFERSVIDSMIGCFELYIGILKKSREA